MATDATTNNDSNDDYMSMDFILNAQSFDDNRNNKINERRKKSKKRKLFSSHQQKSNNFEPKRKKLKIRMEEQRNKGLAEPISKNNIGYKLLSKMGYKQSKNTQKEEPMEIVIRDKKSGLGMYEMKNEKVKKLKNLIAHQKKNRNKDFKQSIRQKSKHRQCIKQIKESMIICQNLDAKSEKNKNNQITLLDDEEIETLSYTECMEKLNKILFYLRQTHLFCFWCGIQYDDAESLLQECPGNDQNLHDSLNDF